MVKESVNAETHGRTPRMYESSTYWKAICASENIMSIIISGETQKR